MSDTQVQATRLQGLLSASTQRVSDLEAEKNTLIELKTKRELEVEDVLREIKALEDEKSQVVHLKSMELSTLRGAHEQVLAGKQGSVKQL